ncbi:PAP2 superfamily protein [Aliiruegeria haliotis]|uniref:PAP2 superfamily protein n=1 Tax=Aliiruegeria haliotis TaxID=1280846 RepID=A0A2T0RRI1_9RHOB|nr:phosphatase PAP2 family protein [Aliiruegeria haliotis]PRY23794.1 PAP2 superfamily protein [Aliiruegeria haliotis]
MRAFFRLSLLYLVFAMVMVELVRGDAVVSIAVGGIDTASDFASSWKVILILLGVTVAASVFGGRSRRLHARFARLGLALVGTVMFMTAFGLLKVLMPDIVPFYADPALADFDSWLHGGVDPWRLTHDWAASLPMRWIEPLYFPVWTSLTLFMPAILALLDRDEARVRRFLLLWAFAWIVVGNVFALGGLSVGPVFYDRLLGGDRFADLTTAIDNGIFTSPLFEIVQDSLWRFYVDGEQILGSGISAFPSVHVATACVTMLYLCERFPWLAPVGIVYLAAIQFLSVFSGYHYAVDGYFSILAMFAASEALHRLDKPRNASTSARPLSP